MRFVAVDWGTSRCRAILVEDGRPLARQESEDGIARLRPGDHLAVFERLCGAWLEREPGLPVLLAGMVGSREGWVAAPYATCPVGPAEIAARLAAVEFRGGRRGFVVPGATNGSDDPADVMRGEETHLLGSGVDDGLVVLPGTHCKWAEMRGGRIRRFSTYVTGELHGLMREHSMIGRPAREPADPSGFLAGLDTIARDPGGLSHALFGARAATLTGRLAPEALGPFLSGLLTGAEIDGALSLHGTPDVVTIVADPPRADLYVEALGRRGITTRVVGQEDTLLRGLLRIVEARRERGAPDHS